MEPASGRSQVWQYLEPDGDSVSRLGNELSVSGLTAALLVNRNINATEEALRFINPNLKDLPSPFLLKGMDAAVARLLACVNKKEKLLVFGDYDADGMCATALLVQFFRAVGVDTSYILPDRLRDGYGLNMGAVEFAVRAGIRLIVTVDCGISNRAEVEHAAGLGIDVIVTDHHIAPPELPRAAAVVNPKQPGCAYPDRGLAGVGVAFNLALAMRKALRDGGFFESAPEPNMKEYLDLVAIGTVADVMPCTGSNRIMIKSGIKEIELGGRQGIAALKKAAGVEDREIGSKAIGFQLAPRINASGRVGDPAVAVELLLTRDRQTADRYSSELNSCNLRRQRLEDEILKSAGPLLAALPPGRVTVVLDSEGWHAGVLGIAASRISEAYMRPVVLISSASEPCRGSARAPSGIDLVDCLSKAKAHLARFGGHRAAAGLLLRKADIPGFAEEFESAVRALYGTAKAEERLNIDARVELSQLDSRQMLEIEKLAPFGQMNPEPVLATDNLTVTDKKVFKNGVTGYTISDGSKILDAISFARTESLPFPSGMLCIAYTPFLDRWGGSSRIKLEIKAHKKAL